jgi:hypothetical protein
VCPRARPCCSHLSSSLDSTSITSPSPPHAPPPPPSAQSCNREASGS